MNPTSIKHLRVHNLELIKLNAELLEALKKIRAVPLPLIGDTSPTGNNVRACFEIAKQSIIKAEGVIS